MIGGEHKKERFSERASEAQNQPKNRGYLQGTQTKTDGYSCGTLQGNWTEERADAGYYDGKPLVRPDQSVWTTTYQNMSAHHNTTPAEVADRFSQETLVDIEDHTQRAFPGHQPHLQRDHEGMVADSLHTVSQKAYQKPTEVVRPTKAPVVLGGNPASQGRAVILRLRQSLKSKMPGQSCVPGNVARTLRLALSDCCTNKDSNCVNVNELREGLLQVGVESTTAECMVLIRYFDVAGDNTAPLNAIAEEIRGPLNDRRGQLVENVYSLLKSVSPDGLVTYHHLADLADLRFLPSVQKGEATLAEATDAYRRQIGFTSPKSLVQPKLFMDIFADFSFELDLDNDFEKVMRNLFHLSGGIGPSANTSCRRVRVIHLNGRITDEEIKNDITIRGDADTVKDEMKKNLRAQGITDVKDIQVTNDIPTM